MADATRVCRGCGQAFEITPAERGWLEETAARAGWGELQLPNRCTPCRFARRRERERVRPRGVDVRVVCVECGNSFVFEARDQEYYARQEWPSPRRCRPCRDSGRALRPR